MTVLFFPAGSLALGNDTLDGLSSGWELLCSALTGPDSVGMIRSSSATGSADGSTLVEVAAEVDLTVEEAAAACEATAAGLGAAVDTSLKYKTV